jgi:hypothetical protein
MQADAPLIEEIISRVLKALGTTSGDSLRATPASDNAGQPGRKEASIAAQIVTWDVLDRLAETVREIRVAPKAIFTPSGRDYIRQHSLTVIRETAMAAKGERPRWQVIVCKATTQVTAALDGLRSAGLEFERCLLGEPREAAGHATNVLCRAEAAGVIVFSDQPELVACLANRNERVRGTALGQRQALDRIRKSLRPNLLAVDPSSQSQFELRQLVQSIITTIAPR